MESLLVEFTALARKYSLSPEKAIPVLGCGVACLFSLACWLLWLVPMVGWLVAFPAQIVGFLGNGFAAIYMYHSAGFGKQLDKMTKTNVALAKSVDDLKANNDRLAEELASLDEFRKGLRKYADSTKGNINELIEKSNAMYRKMKNLTRDNNRTLLMRIAQDLEFLDRKEGEFERFIQRIPKQLQPSLASMPCSFDDLDTSNNQVIDFKEIQVFVEKLLRITDREEIDLTAQSK